MIYIQNDAPFLFGEDGQLEYPNQLGFAQPAMPKSEQEFRNFENAQKANQVDRNVQENSWSSEEAMQEEALFREWSNQGLDSEFNWTPASEENSASGSVSPFGSNAQTQFSPVEAPNPSPIASTSSEDFIQNPAAFYGSQTQSGQNFLRGVVQQFQNSTHQHLVTYQIETNQGIEIYVSVPIQSSSSDEKVSAWTKKSKKYHIEIPSIWSKLIGESTVRRHIRG
ncbi:Hypothetical predicted protein [Cloeon dipterum]|uniref:Uncharacterized protein n=1 Tax=Cloeon dipterum TaxID=197152 RepID=A0A8S1E4T1_9INSE|nr:Hypothetical predicted protein [Cloeon dipterum]